MQIVNTNLLIIFLVISLNLCPQYIPKVCLIICGICQWSVMKMDEMKDTKSRDNICIN